MAVRVEGLGKKYRLGTHTSYGRLTESVQSGVHKLFRGRSAETTSPPETVWALKDVSLQVTHGEIVGLIGRNGAGKTTLLKILSRITEPTTGLVEIRGRAGSLLEVGTGFHPELTGRENVFLNGAILGMSKREIARKFDQIADFAEIDRFLDTPVKRYSSGMYVRLAFAVAAHLDTDVLMVDEVLAVGDMAFQKKCLSSMSQAARSGRTVFLVSHNMAAIHRLCGRCALLESGRLVALGPTADVVSLYTKGMVSSQPMSRDPSSPISFARVSLEHEGRLQTSFSTQDSVDIIAEYQVNQTLAGADIGVWVLSPEGFVIFSTFDTDSSPHFKESRPPGRYATRMRIPAGFLNAGEYLIRVLAYESHRRVYDDNQDLVLQIVNRVGDDARTGWGHRTGAINPRFDWETRRVHDSPDEPSETAP